MGKKSEWELLSSKDISPSKWMPVEERVYQKPDGGIVDDFSVVVTENVSLIIPITTQGKIILAEQFKPGAGKLTLEFPGGRLKPDQSYLQAAEAELREETGMVAGEFIELGETITFPTKGSERIMNFIATGCRKIGEQSLDEHEDIDLVELSASEIDEMITSGEINTAPSITLWYLAKDKQENLLY
jgi:8-oxo-dGTP pyrophosphatase MutT (NUDIX family)